MILTYKFRLHDKHAAELNRQARIVNFVWNYCNETQQKAVKDRRQWLDFFDLKRLTARSSKELNICAHTIQRVCMVYDRARKAKRSPWLRWRGRKSLGWVPFAQGKMRLDGDAFIFRKHRYAPMHLREISDKALIRAGSFNADAKGRWYVNITIDIAEADRAPLRRVGIDLGLKDLVVLSDGRKIEAPRFYRELEDQLGNAQRARKSRLVRAIYRKVGSRRSDFLHKLSHSLSTEYGLIIVGDVSPSKLAQTSMAKSVHDAGWSDLRAKLSYKSIRNGGACLEVSERMTTQTCSSCGSIPQERPRGIAGLGIRVWRCSDCGADHDRDVNAACNILRVGLDTLAEGAARSGAAKPING